MDGQKGNNTNGSADEVTNEQTSLSNTNIPDWNELRFVLKDVLWSVLTVLLVGVLLYSISGVWPPMVAVESGSMHPNLQKGDLVFITESSRFKPDSATAYSGTVPYQSGQERGYRTFDSYGSVVIYKQPGRSGPPIIHRARFWVDDGENWYSEANKSYIDEENCSELKNCPAPHGGFITKGDNNDEYDQSIGLSPPIKTTWIEGVARIRIPYLGCIRLGLGESSCIW